MADQNVLTPSDTGTPQEPPGLQEIMTEMQQLMELRARLPEDAKEQGAIMLRLRQLEEMIQQAGVPGRPPTGLDSGNSAQERPQRPFVPQPGLPGAPPGGPGAGVGMAPPTPRAAAGPGPGMRSPPGM